MTLMAGFDFVAEISNETIRKLFMNELKIDGVTASPPFELNLPFPLNGDNGYAHLIVTDLQVDLNADDTITLTLSFDRMAVVPIPSLPFAICPLDGNITITAALQSIESIDAGGHYWQVSVNLPTATVAINWSAAADQEITKDLSSPAITPDDFKSKAAQKLTEYVRKLPVPDMKLKFHGEKGKNGQLTPSPQFEWVEFHCIPNADRSKQALGIFGILLVANDANGDYTQKTSTAITAAHDGVCISIAPGAFHQFVFCIGIARELLGILKPTEADLTQLPGSCGTAGGFDTQGVTINSISDSFADGHIDINGSVSKSGECYNASGTFHGTLTFSISGSTLQPDVQMDNPNIDVSIPWYCTLVAGVVLGPIGIALAAIADAVADNIARSLAGDTLQNALGSGMPSVSVGGLSGALFSSVAITTEGLTFQGTFPLSVSHPFVMPMLDLSGSVITTNSQNIGSGVFHAQIWCMPQAKDYPYTEYSQQQTGIYHLSGTMVSQPLTPHFTIDAGGPAVPLNGNQGTIVLPNVITHYPMPLATAGTAMQQTVHIGYSISGTSIQLTNVPSEGNYSFYLKVTATDCNGNPVQDDTHHNLSTFVHVQFEGDHVDIGGGYAADVQYCAQHLRQWLQGVIDKFVPNQIVPIWQQVNYPAPEELIEYIRDVVALGIQQADEILVASKIAHGNSFYRALFSPAASQPGLLQTKADLALGQQQLANIARELESLSQQVLNAGRVTSSAAVVQGIREKEIER